MLRLAVLSVCLFVCSAEFLTDECMAKLVSCRDSDKTLLDCYSEHKTCIVAVASDMAEERDIYEDYQGCYGELVSCSPSDETSAKECFWKYKSCIGDMHPDCAAIKSPQEILEGVTGCKSKPIMEAYAAQVNCLSKDHAAQKENKKFMWVLTEDDPTVPPAKYMLDYSVKPFVVTTPSDKDSADVTITMPEDTFIDITLGDIKAKDAFEAGITDGSFKIDGDAALCLKLDALFEME